MGIFRDYRLMGPLGPHKFPQSRIPKDMGMGMGSLYGSRLPFSGVPCPCESLEVVQETLGFGGAPVFFFWRGWESCITVYLRGVVLVLGLLR